MLHPSAPVPAAIAARLYVRCLSRFSCSHARMSTHPCTCHPAATSARAACIAAPATLGARAAPSTSVWAMLGPTSTTMASSSGRPGWSTRWAPGRGGRGGCSCIAVLRDAFPALLGQRTSTVMSLGRAIECSRMQSDSLADGNPTPACRPRRRTAMLACTSTPPPSTSRQWTQPPARCLMRQCWLRARRLLRSAAPSSRPRCLPNVPRRCWRQHERHAQTSCNVAAPCIHSPSAKAWALLVAPPLGLVYPSSLLPPPQQACLSFHPASCMLSSLRVE